MPRNRGKNTTLIAGFALTGSQAPLILAGAVDTDVFERSVEDRLASTRAPGPVGVLGHLSVHTSRRARQTMGAHGCQLLFLPASSPDLPRLKKRFPR